MESQAHQPIGNLSGRYELIKRIGYGASCKVYLARRVSDGMNVAVKVPKANIGLRDVKNIFTTGMEAEVKLMGNLANPNLIRLLEYGYDGKVEEKDLPETSNLPFMVLEYAEGGELFDYIVSGGPLTERFARYYFRQLIEAIGYLH